MFGPMGAQHKKFKLPFYNISQVFNSNYAVVWNFCDSRQGKSAADGEVAVIKTFLRIESTKSDLILDNARQVLIFYLFSSSYSRRQ